MWRNDIRHNSGKPNHKKASDRAKILSALIETECRIARRHDRRPTITVKLKELKNWPGPDTKFLHREDITAGAAESFTLGPGVNTNRA
jgi:hypothetical protein